MYRIIHTIFCVYVQNSNLESEAVAREHHALSTRRNIAILEEAAVFRDVI